MAESELDKYVRKTAATTEGHHTEVTSPRLMLKSDEDFGDLKFGLGSQAITQPFEMVSEHHYHDFNQFLFFTGGDGTNMPDLGGVVELTLSKDGKNKKKYTITEATCVYIPVGMYHCPLNFKQVNGPQQPIIFQNLFFTSNYKKLS